jgi:hippurate hydrolase
MISFRGARLPMLLTLWVGAFGASFVAHAAVDPSEVGRRIDRELTSLQVLYRELHQRPELSYQEAETARRVADELERAGVAVTRQVGGHGVVGVLTNGVGPVLLLRADLDGLPVREQTGLPFSSTHRMTNDLGERVPTMHACGHDIHMTSLVGSARVLSGMRAAWKGTVVFLGQPAEERGSGARAVLKDRLFERFPKPTACVALHCNASLLTGSLGFVEGFTFANVDSVDITVRGVGGHGAYPHLTKDPIVLASQIVMALQTVVSRETRPGDPAVVTVGSIHGGSKHNIIPDSVHLQLTLRSYTEEVRQNTLSSIRRICKGLAESAGLPPELHPEITLANEFTPALYNDPQLTQRLAISARRWLGDGRVHTLQPVMGGEDFSEFGRTADKIPICQFWLGVVSPEANAAAVRSGKPLPSLHSPYFQTQPEPTLRTGITALVTTVLELAPAGP